MRILILVILAVVGLRAADLRPDLIIVLADDLGWGDLASYGGTTPTPHLDRLAVEGARFTQAYVAAPVCSPSRCGLLTGQHPARWRITSYLQDRKGNRACGQVDFLDPAAPTLPRLLKQSGYATAHIGKWHLGGGRDVDDAPRFAAYGYDLGLGTWESPEPHPDLTATDWIWSAKDPVKRWERSGWMVDQGIAFLVAHPAQPCFINLWLDDTHTPWVPAPQDESTPGQEKPARLRAVLTEMDRQIGRLMAHLRTRGRPAVLVFLGDNGPAPTLQGVRAGGLRGSKLSLYEGGVRVPFIAWGPGIIAPGRTDEQSVVSALDLLPTCCGWAGITAPVGDGVDIRPALEGRVQPRGGTLYFEYGRTPTGFKHPAGRDRSPALALRQGDWKLLADHAGTTVELYDLAHDRTEQDECSARHPGVAARLKAALLGWWATMPR